MNGQIYAPWEYRDRFIVDRYAYTICEIMGAPSSDFHQLHAHLIASLPDLLAACHAAHSYFASHSNGSNEASEKFRLLGAAIARAEGRDV